MSDPGWSGWVNPGLLCCLAFFSCSQAEHWVIFYVFGKEKSGYVGVYERFVTRHLLSHRT